LDGIDIDWEYPGQVGGGNVYDPADTRNFLELLRLLRSSLPEGALLTAAVEAHTFQGSNGQPLKDVRAFAQVLDWIMIMNYDVWGGDD
jgi:chitinase